MAPSRAVQRGLQPVPLIPIRYWTLEGEATISPFVLRFRSGRHLLMERYVDKDKARQAELNRCLEINLANRNVDAVHAFVEAGAVASLPRHGKLVVVERDRRTTFADVFAYASTVLPGCIVALANADIYFDETLGLVSPGHLDGSVYCLARWDVTPEGKSVFTNRDDSSDVWMWKPPLEVRDARFWLGIPGCDNRISRMFLDAGRRVLNPSVTLKTHHLHLTGRRNYDPYLPVPGPYLRVPPCELPPSPPLQP